MGSKEPSRSDEMIPSLEEGEQVGANRVPTADRGVSLVQ